MIFSIFSQICLKPGHLDSWDASCFIWHNIWLVYLKQYFIVIYYFTLSFSLVSFRACALQRHVWVFRGQVHCIVYIFAAFPAPTQLLSECIRVTPCPLLSQPARGKGRWEKLDGLSTSLAWSFFLYLYSQECLTLKKQGEEVFAQGV